MEILFLFVLIFAFSALVLPFLSRPLEKDELDNYNWHLTLPFGQLLTTMVAATNHLGYSVLAWCCMRIMGDSPFAVRFPAFAGGMLLPLTAYCYGRRFHGRPTAVIVALLIAAWPDFIAAAIQARGYSLLLVGAMIHIWAFRQLISRPTSITCVLYVLSLAVTSTFHLWFVLVGLCEYLFYLGWLTVTEGCLLPGISPSLSVNLQARALFTLLSWGWFLAAVLQMGLMPKYLYIMTQSGLAGYDGLAVLAHFIQCLEGQSFDYIPPWHSSALFLPEVRLTLTVVVLCGIILAIIRVRWDQRMRFDLAYGVTLCLLLPAIGIIQKPVYLYARFFLVVPLTLILLGCCGLARFLAGGGRDRLQPSGGPEPE